MVKALWFSFLAVWAGALLWFGAVRPEAIAATSIAMAVLYGLSLILLSSSCVSRDSSARRLSISER